VSKLLLSFYDIKRSEGCTEVLVLIRKTILQKCRRIFNRCCRLLFPENKKKRKRNSKSDDKHSASLNNRHSSSNDNKIENDLKTLNKNVEKVKSLSKTNKTKRIDNKTKILNNFNEDAVKDELADEEDEEIDSNNKSSSSVIYPFQQLMNELSGFYKFYYYKYLLYNKASYAKQFSFTPIQLKIKLCEFQKTEKVECKIIDVNPSVLCGQGNWLGDDPTIIICITGLKDLYYEILYLFSTNYKLKKLRCFVILSKEEWY